MEVAAKLSKACKTDTELVISSPNHSKLPRVYNGTNSRLSGRDDWLKDRIDQGANRLAHPGCRDGDEWSLRPMRLHANQHATRHYVLPGSLESMDHALGCDSSKGPAEECDVEWGAAKT